MAKEVIAFQVNLRKNQNETSSAYGKYYVEADTKEPINLKGFARHLSEHGKLVDYPLAVLVLQNIVACLKEMAVQGQPVKLDGFGTFSPIIETDGTQVANTVEAALEKGLDALIAGVHLRFVPENSKGEQLTSRALKKECVFSPAYVVSRKVRLQDGKKKYYQEKIPISSYQLAMATDSPGGNSGNSGDSSDNQTPAPSGGGDDNGD